MENVSLLKIVVTNISYDFSIESTETINLEIRQNTRLNPPKNLEDKTIMLTSEMTICEPKNKSINILIRANAFFGFDCRPETYDEIVEKKCVPIVFEKLSEKVDEIMEVLGYPKFNLKYEPIAVDTDSE